MKNNNTAILLGILFGILCLIATTAIGLALIHASHTLYSVCLDVFDIPGYSGFSREECLVNYDAVMKFLSPFNHSEFDLPIMTYSQSGAQHFADCRPIFNGIYLLGSICLALAFIIGPAGKKKFGKSLFRISGITTIAVPAVFLCAVTIDFDAAFVLFHKVFFSNDMWLFDPSTDPIIDILPEEFFLVCAVFIAAIWIISAVLQLIYSKRKKKENV